MKVVNIDLLYADYFLDKINAQHTKRFYVHSFAYRPHNSQHREGMQFPTLTQLCVQLLVGVTCHKFVCMC